MYSLWCINCDKCEKCTDSSVLNLDAIFTLLHLLTLLKSWRHDTDSWSVSLNSDQSIVLITSERPILEFIDHIAVVWHCCRLVKKSRFGLASCQRIQRANSPVNLSSPASCLCLLNRMTWTTLCLADLLVRYCWHTPVSLEIRDYVIMLYYIVVNLWLLTIFLINLYGLVFCDWNSSVYTVKLYRSKWTVKVNSWQVCSILNICCSSFIVFNMNMCYLCPLFTHGSILLRLVCKNDDTRHYAAWKLIIISCGRT